MAKNGASWQALENEISQDQTSVALNVDIPKSLKRELTIEKAKTGMTLRDIAVAALTDYLRKQNGVK